MKLRLRQRMTVLTVVPLAWVFVLLLSFAWIEAQSTRAAAQERASAAVVMQSQRVLGAVEAAETGARGYVATGETSLTVPYRNAASSVPALLADLKNSVADEPAQRAALGGIRASALAQLAASGDEIAAMSAGQQWRAAALLASPASAARLASLRKAIASFEGREVTANAARSDSAYSLWFRWALLLILGSAVVGAVTVLLNKVFTTGVINRLALLADQIRRVRGGDTFVERVGGNDEVTAVENEFVGMTFEFAQRQTALARYRMLSDVTTDLIFFTDRATLRIIEANEAAAQAYGYTREAMRSLIIQDLCAPDSPAMYSTTPPPDNDRAALLFESMHRRSDGSTFPVEVASQSATIDGQHVIISTVRDITERRRTQLELSRLLDEALQASRLKTEFVATMSHEIRTPMNGVAGMIDLLLHTDLTEDQREFATTVKESADSLMVIINDILDFSKLEAGRVDLEAVDFEVAHVIESVVALLNMSAKQKGLTIALKISPRIPARISGDPARLRQILLNLVANAVKFTERGSITIRASVESASDDALVLRFSVADTGLGISEEAQGRLFQPFVQADGSTTRRFGGTGLGLSISRRLVELMGGRISLQSTEGKGSTFTFTARFRNALAGEGIPLAPKQRGRLLIVDDDPEIRDVLQRYASSWGFSVRHVSSAPAAITALIDATAEARPFDIVLIDCILPGIDGLGLVQMIRDEPRSGEPATIMMTAYDAAARREQAAAAGCAAYLVKPIAPSDLHDLISSVMSDRRIAALPAGELPPPKPAPVPRPSGRARILLAEDTPTNQRVATLQVQRLGYAVDVVNDGSEAVEAVKSNSYDLILMDCQMPVMDGYTATRRIREHEVETGRHITIVALTANALERDRRACFDAGMDAYLAKPLQSEALKDVLEQWLPHTDPVEATAS